MPKRKKEEAAGLLDDKAWGEFVDALGVDLRHGGDRAYYHSISDYVQMPAAKRFKSRQHYKCVSLHEITHWTGNTKRLNRKQDGPHKGADYAREELVAEMGAAFLCAKFGIAHPELRHGPYIKMYLSVLKTDKRALSKATSAASAAVKYIEELTVKKAMSSKITRKRTSKKEIEAIQPTARKRLKTQVKS